MTKPWLTVIGMGEDGWSGISASAQASLKAADVIIGTERLQSLLPNLTGQKENWPQPFSALVNYIHKHRGKNTVVLATGDPSNFGVARRLHEIFPRDEIKVIPHRSAFSLAAAALGWSIPDCDCLTIHGRPAAALEAFVQPDAKLLVLTQDETSIAEICRRLVARGFEDSAVTVLENLGGPKECISHFRADVQVSKPWSPLNTVAIECQAGGLAKIWSRVGGLPDEAFLHDGQLTKREVRAATLAALCPAPDQMLWDIGAGCGSVAIEWMRSTRGCLAVAIEPHEGRRAMIAHNADQLGTPMLRVVSSAAPAGLEGLPQPHAIFIGGGIGDDGVFEAAWKALRPGGHMVCNVVTIEGKMRLFDLNKEFGGDLVKIDVSHLANVGPYRALKPRMSVLQWRVKKS